MNTTLIIVLIGTPIYFIPTFIAFKKNCKDKIAISIINLFLGVTLLGWIASLLWAISEKN